MEIKTRRPLILISNDDSAGALGLHYLIDCVSEFGDVIAVAPAYPNSGMSSAITVETPLRLKHVETYNGSPIYSVTGTPVDCVKLALNTLFDRRPDLMLSGINHGANSGNSVIYSGTMGAAMEACMSGIPAVGYSLLDHSPEADFSQTTPFIKDITARVLAGGLPDGICLNINFPANCKIEGIKVTRAARGYWSDEYVKYTDPTGRPTYWLAGRFNNLEIGEQSTDVYWLDRHWATIVPVRVDQSAIDTIEYVSSLLSR